MRWWPFTFIKDHREMQVRMWRSWALGTVLNDLVLCKSLVVSQQGRLGGTMKPNNLYSIPKYAAKTTENMLPQMLSANVHSRTSSIDPKWKHPKCLSTDEHISQSKYYSTMKSNETLTHVTIWRTLKTLWQMMKSVPKNRQRSIPYMWKGQEWQMREIESRLSFQASSGSDGNVLSSR